MTRRPQDLAWPDLVMSHFTRPRFGAFDERLDAAAAAGFAGIGLYLYEFERLRSEESRTPQRIADDLASRGLVLGELEAIRNWWALEGEALDRFEHELELAVAMADGIGARYLQAIGSYECEFQQAVDGLGRLCDRMAQYDVLVGVEYLPFTNITTEAEVLALVSATGRANAGYCADIWHHVRGANDPALLLALPGDKVFAVQMNDGPLRPVLDDYKADCMISRVPPGEGEFDCVGFVRNLRTMGVTAPISLEVCNEALWQRPAVETARRAVDGMRRALEAAGA